MGDNIHAPALLRAAAILVPWAATRPACVPSRVAGPPALQRNGAASHSVGPSVTFWQSADGKGEPKPTRLPTRAIRQAPWSAVKRIRRGTGCPLVGRCGQTVWAWKRSRSGKLRPMRPCRGHLRWLSHAMLQRRTPSFGHWRPEESYLRARGRHPRFPSFGCGRRRLPAGWRSHRRSEFVGLGAKRPEPTLVAEEE